MPLARRPYLAIASRGCEPVGVKEGGAGRMRLTRKCVARGVLAALLCAAALAAAGAARAEAFAGVLTPRSAVAQPPLQPIQAQQPPNVEASLAMLHQRLGITPAQEGAFAGLANVMRENARMSMGAPPPATASAPYQLRASIQAIQQYVNDMRRMLPPLESLYAVLSPQQQAIANQLFRQGPGR